MADHGGRRDDSSLEAYNHTSIGKPQRKKIVDFIDCFAVLLSLLCLGVAIITVSPYTLVPFRLGLKRQLQIIGFLLSVMNQCSLIVTPKFFLTVEARFGRSTLQNYDAILRKAVFLSKTYFPWRLLLFAQIAFPIVLSFLYKEFQQGISIHSGEGSSFLNGSEPYYGMTGPSGLSQAKSAVIGISLVVNATLPFVLATQDDPVFPSTPQVYGFNTLLLSNISAAYLDAPMPAYVTSIQERLHVDETLYLSANVNATVTTYNASVDSRRNDSAFWGYYSQLLNTNDLSGALLLSDIHNNWSFGLLDNDLGREQDSSFCFAGFAPANKSSNLTSFEENALLFETGRTNCKGTWRITNDAIGLSAGSCDPSAQPGSGQNLFTHASFAFRQYFVSTLIEYLAPFSQPRRQSHWLVPKFSTTIAGMYWARATTLNGDPTIRTEPTDFYYPVKDEYELHRPSMNASGLLYVILALQPALSVFIFIANILLHRTPIGRDFGLVALLSGVQINGLHLLEGSSFSGRLKHSIRVQLAVDHMENDLNTPKIRYILDGKGKNDPLSRSSIAPLVSGHLYSAVLRRMGDAIKAALGRASLLIMKPSRRRKKTNATRPPATSLRQMVRQNTRYQRISD